MWQTEFLLPISLSYYKMHFFSVGLPVNHKHSMQRSLKVRFSPLHQNDGVIQQHMQQKLIWSHVNVDSIFLEVRIRCMLRQSCRLIERWLPQISYSKIPTFSGKLSSKAGTLARKRELRDMLEQQDEGYEDDAFKGTPFKNQKVSKTLQVFTNFMFIEWFRWQLCLLYSLYSTP